MFIYQLTKSTCKRLVCHLCHLKSNYYFFWICISFLLIEIFYLIKLKSLLTIQQQEKKMYKYCVFDLKNEKIFIVEQDICLIYFFKKENDSL